MTVTGEWDGVSLRSPVIVAASVPPRFATSPTERNEGQSHQFLGVADIRRALEMVPDDGRLVTGESHNQQGRRVARVMFTEATAAAVAWEESFPDGMIESSPGCDPARFRALDQPPPRMRIAPTRSRTRSNGPSLWRPNGLYRALDVRKSGVGFPSRPLRLGFPHTKFEHRLDRFGSSMVLEAHKSQGSFVSRTGTPRSHCATEAADLQRRGHLRDAGRAR